MNLTQAQNKRKTSLLELSMDKELERFFALSSRNVSPDARAKLGSLLTFYAKTQNPAKACVRNNMKKFGPGKTEAVCGTLKDMIESTTKQRGRQIMAGLSDENSLPPVIDAETFELLQAIPSDEIQRIAAKMGETHE